MIPRRRATQPMSPRTYRALCAAYEEPPATCILQPVEGPGFRKGGLYLGGASEASHKMFDNENTLIINLQAEAYPSLKKDGYMLRRHDRGAFRYYYPCADYSEFNIDTTIFKLIPIIEHHRNLGRNVVVHCLLGVSRSPTIVTAYVMGKFKLSYKQAYRYVYDLRPVLRINFGFGLALEALERSIHDIPLSVEPAFAEIERARGAVPASPEPQHYRPLSPLPPNRDAPGYISPSDILNAW